MYRYICILYRYVIHKFHIHINILYIISYCLALFFSLVFINSYLIIHSVLFICFSSTLKAKFHEFRGICIFSSRPYLHYLEQRQAHGKHSITFR